MGNSGVSQNGRVIKAIKTVTQPIDLGNRLDEAVNKLITEGWTLVARGADHGHLYAFLETYVP